MFWSKIWFFIVALAGAVALTIALTIPKPAERTVAPAEQTRIGVACSVIDILLADDARNRVEVTGAFARSQEVVNALEAASGVDKLEKDEARMKSVRDIGETIMKGIQGRKPDFAMLVDRRGRVVARVHLDEGDWGDVVAGRPLIDDALAGYLRDDLWTQNGTMYFVSAAPVIKRDPPVAYVGAVVLGHAITNDLAKKLVASLNVDVGFYLGDSEVANSKEIPLDRAKMLATVKKLSGGDLSRDCQANATDPLSVNANNGSYSAVVARLPGEATAKQAYYAVYSKEPDAHSVLELFKDAREHGGLAMSSFPWLFVGGGFLLALALGIGLMLLEADRPLKRLANEAVRLAKGDIERFGEDAHGGKFGSIARSVNIHIDKLGREAKSARKDMDQLLGPAPEGSLGTIDLLATALPSSRPGGAGPAMPPPPSDFKFMDTSASRPPAVPARPTPPPSPPMPPMPAAPPPIKVRTPTAPVVPQPLLPALDDDILGSLGGGTSSPSLSAPSFSPPAAADEDPYFRSVFDQFLATKQQCGEPTTGLTYAKFADKLVKNRDDLMAKTGSREVRFTVYVKDGKAALKATPVKDE